MSPALPIAQSSRVCWTISMITGTPRPSSPRSHAVAPSNSTSLDALERLPSLSLRRCRRTALRAPSSRKRGRKKHDRPLLACASTRCASHIGAEKNHLCPVSLYSPFPTFSARVWLLLTSEPPWRSVIPMPMSAEDLSVAGSERGSYSRDRTRRSHSLFGDG